MQEQAVKEAEVVQPKPRAPPAGSAPMIPAEPECSREWAHAEPHVCRDCRKDIKRADELEALKQRLDRQSDIVIYGGGALLCLVIIALGSRRV